MEVDQKLIRLIKMGEEVLSTGQPPNAVDERSFHRWRRQTDQYLQVTFGAESSYLQDFRQACNAPDCVSDGLSILEEIKEAFESGEAPETASESKGNISIERSAIGILNPGDMGAEGFIKSTVEVGERWLDDYFWNHLPNTQEKAGQNASQFLNHLARQVDQLRKEVQDDRIKQKIASALDDPDFSSLLQNALIISARTENEEKHKILGRIVSERLRVDSEELLALASRLACDAVGYLTISQLRYLGLATLVYFIRPTSIPQDQCPSQSICEEYIDWLSSELSIYESIVPIEDPERVMDLRHFESVSCISLVPFRANEIITELDLNHTLRFSKELECNDLINDFVKNHSTGQWIHGLWMEAMAEVRLTTTGRLIGYHAHDELSQSREA